jgi:tetratricopeptide (TPR) repeat protein
MNRQAAPIQRSVSEQEVLRLMAGVERLVAERRDSDALRVLAEAESILPEHPLVLHERARRLMVGGDSVAARALLERVVALAPQHVPFWLSLAATLRSLERRDEELAALERALTLDPTHLIVLLQKAALLDLMQKPRVAASVYVNALQTLASGTSLPPPVEAHVQHARKRVAENAVELASFLNTRVGALRQAHTAS